MILIIGQRMGKAKPLQNAIIATALYTQKRSDASKMPRDGDDEPVRR